MSAELLFRAAAPDDAASLHDLICAAYRPTRQRHGILRERISRQRLDAVLRDPAHAILLAEGGEKAVGCVQVSRLDERSCLFELLCVAPERQRQGLGGRLLAEAEREAARRFGATRIAIEVISRNPELVGFYRRRGFVATGETRPFPLPEVDLPLVVLVKAL
jgi:ribosomal protein S18 acetylase RimI-like enzyme